ncbi:MAG: MerR family transcriptional regulator [Chloroflexota bacterium]|nr:MerR family transcriptional regulator [Chloroflexota bacterium]
MDDATQNVRNDHYLSLGRFAKTGQLSRKALRLYEELGILVPEHVDPDSGYRYYSPDQLERARFIRMLRGMEMPLADIRRVLAATTPEEAIELVSESAREFETRVAGVRRALEKVLTYLRKEFDTMSIDISMKTFPEQQVVSIKTHLSVPAFQQYIPVALKHISAYIKESGAKISGDPLCFYYGPVNESDDGPVEIGLPIEGEIVPNRDMQVSLIPTHRGAFGTTPPDQSQYPEIIEAWDSVVAWVQENKFTLSDEPVCCYEIWHEDHTITIVQPFGNAG